MAEESTYIMPFTGLSVIDESSASVIISICLRSCPPPLLAAAAPATFMFIGSFSWTFRTYLEVFVSPRYNYSHIMVYFPITFGKQGDEIVGYRYLK